MDYIPGWSAGGMFAGGLDEICTLESAVSRVVARQRGAFDGGAARLEYFGVFAPMTKARGLMDEGFYCRLRRTVAFFPRANYLAPKKRREKKAKKTQGSDRTRANWFSQLRPIGESTDGDGPSESRGESKRDALSRFSSKIDLPQESEQRFSNERYDIASLGRAENKNR
ncbi:hypothetical protein KM043_012676 [Ampulex compressa]|nr:hypothetical protein KM043_012676 [Ampulex compressa]